MVSLRNFSNESHTWMNECCIKLSGDKEEKPFYQNKCSLLCLEHKSFLQPVWKMSLLSQWELCSNKRGMQDPIIFTRMWCFASEWFLQCMKIPLFWWCGGWWCVFLISSTVFVVYKVLRFLHWKSRHDYTATPVIELQKFWLFGQVFWTLNLIKRDSLAHMGWLSSGSGPGLTLVRPSHFLCLSVIPSLELWPQWSWFVQRWCPVE